MYENFEPYEQELTSEELLRNKNNVHVNRMLKTDLNKYEVQCNIDFDGI
jgi:hypothetical protein